MEKSRKVVRSGKRFNKSNVKDSPNAVSSASSTCSSTYKSPLNWSLRGITNTIEMQVTSNNSVLPTENVRNPPGHTDNEGCRPIDSNVTGNSSVVKNTPFKNFTEFISDIFSQPVKSSLENHELSNKTGDKLDETLCVAKQGYTKRKHSSDTNLSDAHITSNSQLGSGNIRARKKQKTCTQSCAEAASLFVSVPAESVMPFNSGRTMTSQHEQTQNGGSLLKSITNDMVYFQDRKQFAHNFAITIENNESCSSVDRSGSALEQSPNNGLVEKVSKTAKLKDSGADGNVNSNAPVGPKSLFENNSSSSKLTAEERKIFDRTIDLSEVDERPDSEASTNLEASTSCQRVSCKLNPEERKIFDRTIDLSEVEVISDIKAPTEQKASRSKQKVAPEGRKTFETTIDLSEDDSIVMCDDSDSSDIVIVKEKVDCDRAFKFSGTNPSTSSECDVVFVGSKKDKKRGKHKKSPKDRKLALMEAHRVALLEADKVDKLLGHTAAVAPRLPSAPSASSSSRWEPVTIPPPDKNFFSFVRPPFANPPTGGPFGPSVRHAHTDVQIWWSGARGQFGNARLTTPQGAKGPPECWNSPGGSKFGNNVYNPSTAPRQTTGLRPIIIDGSNVAMSHGSHNHFSSKGLEICINYFLKKGHKVYAFVPLYRRASHETLDSHILDKLEKQKTLIFTPSRNVDGVNEVPYDDRYIVQCAAEKGGVIVSKDNYRDLLAENPMFADTIKNRLLMFTWVEDMLMFPQDPMGRRGPSLDEMLRF